MSTLPTPWKPTKAQLLDARNKSVPDLIARNLIVLFAGINPGLYTAAIGRHFGRPGNRFWPYQAAALVKLFGDLRLWAVAEHQRRPARR